MLGYDNIQLVKELVIKTLVVNIQRPWGQNIKNENAVDENIDTLFGIWMCSNVFFRYKREHSELNTDPFSFSILKVGFIEV